MYNITILSKLMFMCLIIDGYFVLVSMKIKHYLDFND